LSGRLPDPPPGAQAIALDLFHTLVDPEQFRPAGFLRARAVAGVLGLPPARFSRDWERTLHARQLAVRPTLVQRLRAYCDARSVRPPTTAFARADRLLGLFQDRALLRPTREVVRTLRGLRRRGWTLGLLSNADEREKRCWSRSPLAPFFQAVVFSCDIGSAKPSREAYQSLVPRWGGIPLREAVFVGDGGSHELAGARRAGFARVIFQGGFVSRNGLRSARENRALRAEADSAIDSVAELLAWGGPSGGPLKPPRAPAPRRGARRADRGRPIGR
jgi:putative hydrolase of the HAD superfamily